MEGRPSSTWPVGTDGGGDHWIRPGRWAMNPTGAGCCATRWRWTARIQPGCTWGTTNLFCSLDQEESWWWLLGRFPRRPAAGCDHQLMLIVIRPPTSAADALPRGSARDPGQRHRRALGAGRGVARHPLLGVHLLEESGSLRPHPISCSTKRTSDRTWIGLSCCGPGLASEVWWGSPPNPQLPPSDAASDVRGAPREHRDRP